MMSNWLEKKIFAPISEVQGFYNLTAGKKQLIVPQVEWNKMSLTDLDQYTSHITQGVEKSRISQRTLDLSLGLNRHNEIVNMRQEMIESSIQQREKEALTQMTLAELRALDPEEEIIAPEKDPLPGQTPLTGPGDAGAMPGGGLDLGDGRIGGFHRDLFGERLGPDGVPSFLGQVDVLAIDDDRVISVVAAWAIANELAAGGEQVNGHLAVSIAVCVSGDRPRGVFVPVDGLDVARSATHRQ